MILKALDVASVSRTTEPSGQPRLQTSRGDRKGRRKISEFARWRSKVSPGNRTMVNLNMHASPLDGSVAAHLFAHFGPIAAQHWERFAPRPRNASFVKGTVTKPSQSISI